MSKNIKSKPVYIDAELHERLTRTLKGTGINIQTFVEDSTIDGLSRKNNELSELKEKRKGYIGR